MGEIFRAKKEGRRPGEEEQRQKGIEFQQFCHCWNSLRFNSDGFLTISLAADSRHQERERVVCPYPLRRELIWETHKQAHVGASRVIRCLQMRWYWPGMMRDVRLQVRQCEICQASKHSRSTEITGRRRLYAGCPWQIVAVDSVGPMPMSTHGNNWILLLTDHFTRWADALAIRDASAPTVARALDQHVFCYFGLPEQIHTDQGAQFQSQLMKDLCRVWGVNQSRTTLCHPQGNGVVERNNRMLGDALRSLLLGKSQVEWDAVLPQIMRTYRSNSRSSTQETPNFLMLGWQTWVPDHFRYHVPLPEGPVHEYVRELADRMRTAHEVPREKQWQVRGEDLDEPPLYQTGNWVWMLSYWRKCGQPAKLQPKFVGPYCIIEVLPNHTYRVECSRQISVQSEKRLKPYWASPGAVGQALPLLEPARRPTGGEGRPPPHMGTSLQLT